MPNEVGYLMRLVERCDLPFDMREQADEALKYLSELKHKGLDDEVNEFSSFLSNMVKKQATLIACNKLRRIIGEFSFDMRLKREEIRESITDLREIIPEPRPVSRNPFCKVCNPPVDAEIENVRNELSEAINEAKIKLVEMKKQLN